MTLPVIRCQSSSARGRMVGTASGGAAPEVRFPSTTGDGLQRDLVGADVQEGSGKE